MDGTEALTLAGTTGIEHDSANALVGNVVDWRFLFIGVTQESLLVTCRSTTPTCLQRFPTRRGLQA